MSKKPIQQPKQQTSKPDDPPRDAYHGHGGLFTVVDGQRVLVDCTRPAADLDASRTVINAPAVSKE